MDFFIEFIAEVFIGLVVIVLGTAMVAMAHIIRRNWKEDSKADEFIEEVGERLIDRGENIIYKDEVSSVSIPKKEIKIKQPKVTAKSKPIKSKDFDLKTILILISILFLSSCSLIDGAFGLVKDNVDVTWKFDKTKELKVIDSILVTSKPIYWITDITQFTDGQEKITIKDGYSIWQLRTGDKLRTEVVKLDSTIYIYKVK